MHYFHLKYLQMITRVYGLSNLLSNMEITCWTYLTAILIKPNTAPAIINLLFSYWVFVYVFGALWWLPFANKNFKFKIICTLNIIWRRFFPSIPTKIQVINLCITMVLIDFNFKLLCSSPFFTGREYSDNLISCFV